MDVSQEDREPPSPTATADGGREASPHLILNGLISFLDLSLVALDVLLQGLNDSLQLHLLSLQEVNVIGFLFNILLQAAELNTHTAPTEATEGSELLSMLPDCLNVNSSPVLTSWGASTAAPL